jgi:hypothetical protein
MGHPCAGQREIRAIKMFPGEPNRWWLKQWPRVGPMTWSGALEYEGFLSAFLESIPPSLCRPCTLDKESIEYQRDLFVEVSRGHEDSMQAEELRLLLAELYRQIIPGREVRTNGRASLNFVSTHRHPIHCSTVLVTCIAARP